VLQNIVIRRTMPVRVFSENGQKAISKKPVRFFN
jgi:hypothetical protein